jgi:hydroxyacylglutathione hydrolase
VKEVVEQIGKGALVLDVRTLLETRKGIAPGATAIPLLRLKRHLDELPKNGTIVTYCGAGERAGKAKDILAAAASTPSTVGRIPGSWRSSASRNAERN